MKIKRVRERGSILLSVMVSAVLVAIISAGIMRMAMFRYKMASRSQYVLQEKRDDQGAMAAVVSAWSTNPAQNSACSVTPPGWGACTNTSAYPNNCNCTCTQPVTGVQVVAALSGGVCTLTIGAAHDLMPP